MDDCRDSASIEEPETTASDEDVRRGTCRIAAFLFLRLLGLIYLIAFVSLWRQADGLMGRDGIMPAADLVEIVRTRAGGVDLQTLPTLCWLDASDRFIHLQCAAGTALALLLIVGIAPVPVLLLLWLLYLSLSVVCQPFLGFQWDTLLLETGFMAVFVAPLQLWPRPSRLLRRAPSSAGVWLLRWLLFKLIFLSGVTKLLSGDPTWRDGTALDYHYETQPLPTWIGWYAHQLPSWFQHTSVVLMYVIEIGLPLLIFAPRRIRHVGATGLIALQVLIAATGNYCFFNLLTISLCLLLLDDRLLSTVLPRRWSARLAEPTPAAPRWRRVLLWVPMSALLLASGLSFVREMVRTQRPALLPPIVTSVLDGADALLLRWGEPWVLKPIAPFRTINGYGLFRVMTTERPEIVIEGSDDGLSWEPYEFRWKPGAVDGRPRFVAPHQPRLDWQMWFAALRPRGNQYWLEPLIERLLEGSPAVLELLGDNPFPDDPPRYVRLVYYRYRFTDVETQRATEAWWERERVGVLVPRVALPDR